MTIEYLTFALIVLGVGAFVMYTQKVPAHHAWSFSSLKLKVQSMRLPWSQPKQPTTRQRSMRSADLEPYLKEVNDALAQHTVSTHNDIPLPLIEGEGEDEEDDIAPLPCKPLTIFGMTARRFLELANHSPDIVAHLFVYGPTRSGKTTFVSGVLQSRAGRICIFTPKPLNLRNSGDPWGGLPRFTIDKDLTFTSITKGLLCVLEELRRRMSVLEDLNEDLERLTIILDDYQLLAFDEQTKKLAATIFYMVSNVGAELNMCLIVLATTGSVKGLNIEGLGDSRDGFLTVRLKKGHTASVSWEEEMHTLETDPIVAVSRQPFPHERVWMPEIDDTPAEIESFTHDEIRLALLFADEPDMSFSEAARRLYPGRSGSGRVNQRVKAMYQRLVAASLVTDRSSDDESRNE